MRGIPMVAAINDLSGFGRCSLTVSLPVISAMGLQVCPLPTAILSNHTGYESCFFDDYTEKMPPFIQEWEKRGLQFAAIYTGFLGSAAQAEVILAFIAHFCGEDTMLLVDPVMADHGKLYSTCDEKLCKQMARLVEKATVVTPNLTEACILCGEDYADLVSNRDEAWRLERVESITNELMTRGTDKVVITGIPLSGNRIGNFCSDKKQKHLIDVYALPENYAGTGDLFASVICGALTGGVPLEKAVRLAADFVRDVSAYCWEHRLPPMDGMAFEPFLGRLAADFQTYRKM